MKLNEINITEPFLPNYFTSVHTDEIQQRNRLAIIYTIGKHIVGIVKTNICLLD